MRHTTSRELELKALKKLRRRGFSQARNEMPQDLKAVRDDSIVAYCATLVRALPSTPRRIATYAPVGTEPGGKLLVDALQGESSEVILPVSGKRSKLTWSTYLGSLKMVPGALNTSEPDGERYETNVLFDCDIIFVPALAVTPSGFRLGKGGGYYDRTLTELREMAQAHGIAVPTTAALVYDHEIVEDLPVSDNDQHCDLIVTPTGVRETEPERVN